MTYTQTVDRIIEIAEVLGYGIDVDFTSRKPIKIKPLRGTAKSFQTPAHALTFLELHQADLSYFGSSTKFVG